MRNQSFSNLLKGYTNLGHDGFGNLTGKRYQALKYRRKYTLRSYYCRFTKKQLATLRKLHRVSLSEAIRDAVDVVSDILSVDPHAMDRMKRHD